MTRGPDRIWPDPHGGTHLSRRPSRRSLTFGHVAFRRWANPPYLLRIASFSGPAFLDLAGPRRYISPDTSILPGLQA